MSIQTAALRVQGVEAPHTVCMNKELDRNDSTFRRIWDSTLLFREVILNLRSSEPENFYCTGIKIESHRGAEAASKEKAHGGVVSDEEEERVVCREVGYFDIATFSD